MKCAGVLNRFHDHLSFSFRCYSRTAALSSFVALTSASACGLWLLRRAPGTLGQRKTRKFEIASVTCHAGLRQIQDHHVLAADIAHALLRRKVLNLRRIRWIPGPMGCMQMLSCFRFAPRTENMLARPIGVIPSASSRKLL